MKEFIIDESKWRCGGISSSMKGAGVTQLLNEQGYMCCLGQIACSLGVNDKLLIGRSVPSEILKMVPTLDEDIKILEHGDLNTTLSLDAMEINDDISLTHERRKKDLIHLFQNHDIDLTFINGNES